MASKVPLDLDERLKQPCAAILHHPVTVAQGSLGRRLGQFGEGRVREVCTAIVFALGREGGRGRPIRWSRRHPERRTGATE